MAFHGCHPVKPPPHFTIERISEGTTWADGPCVACAPNGSIALAWGDNHGGTQNIWLLEKGEGGSWSSPLNISHSPYEGRNPSICFDSVGTLHAVWSQSSSGGWALLYSRRDESGVWSVPETVRSGDAVRPHIGVDGLGNVHLEFWDIAADGICYARRGSDGVWDAPRRMRNGFDDENGSMCITRNGVVFIAWEDWSTSPARIFAAERSPAGEWGQIGQPYESRSFCQEPKLAAVDTTACLVFAEAEGRGRLVEQTATEGGGWSVPDTSLDDPSPTVIAAASSTRGSLVAAYGSSPSRFLAVRREGTSWEKTVISDSLRPDHTISLAVDRNRVVHLAWDFTARLSERPDVFYTSVPLDSIVN